MEMGEAELELRAVYDSLSSFAESRVHLPPDQMDRETFRCLDLLEVLLDSSGEVGT